MPTVRRDANIIELRLELEFIENHDGDLGLNFLKYPLFKISTNYPYFEPEVHV